MRGLLAVRVSHQERALLEVESRVTAIVFAPDGRSLYTAHANTTCGKLALADLLRESNG